MEAFVRYIIASTLKREAASIIMVWYLGIGSVLMLSAHPTVTFKEAWMALMYPVFGIFTAAFGTDWISKQTNIAGPPANTETTLKTETTDTGTTVTTKSEPTTSEPVAS
jgi:hypothetical protein